jgi:hypothetical protein
MEQVPSLLVTDEKLKDPKNVAYALNDFFLPITGKKNNIQQADKGYPIQV